MAVGRCDREGRGGVEGEEGKGEKVGQERKEQGALVRQGNRHGKLTGNGGITRHLIKDFAH